MVKCICNGQGSQIMREKKLAAVTVWATLLTARDLVNAPSQDSTYHCLCYAGL